MSERNPNLVELRPIENVRWHGKSGKDNFAQDKSSQILYNPSTGKYATGLTEEEAKKYGELMGVDLGDTFNPNKPHEFWSTKVAHLKFPNRTLILDMAKPLDFIKVKNYKASLYVANSEKEYQEGLWPLATHILYDESEHIEIEAHKINKKKEAYKIADKLTKEQKVSLIQILLDISVRKQSNEFIEVKIGEIIEGDLINDFLRYSKLDKQFVYVKGMVVEALYKNILNKEGSGIYYMGDILGHSVDDVVEYFLSPQNQEIKARILEKLN
jgi:hypothetical protein